MERAFAVVLPILAAGNWEDEVGATQQDGHEFQVCSESDVMDVSTHLILHTQWPNSP